jgi:hypothetical protein
MAASIPSLASASVRAITTKSGSRRALTAHLLHAEREIALELPQANFLLDAITHLLRADNALVRPMTTSFVDLLGIACVSRNNTIQHGKVPGTSWSSM